jgi:hypothetical protein
MTMYYRKGIFLSLQGTFSGSAYSHICIGIFWIRDVSIRIRTCGSVALDSESGSCYFSSVSFIPVLKSVSDLDSIRAVDPDLGGQK